MGRTITLASGKGGVGKTTITANLGIALAKAGFRVCLVDADIAMANLSLLLGMQSSPITLHDVLLGEAAINDAIYDGPDGVKFIPSGLSLENYRRVDSERLHGVIEAIKESFDFILVDAPAGIEKNVLAAISAAEEVLLIVTPDSPSIADVLKTRLTAQRLNVRPIGFVTNFVRHEKGEISSEEIMKMLECPLYGEIPYDTEVRRSFMQEKVNPVILRMPNCAAAAAILRLASKLTGKEVTVESKQSQPFIQTLLNTIGSLFKSKKQKVPVNE